MKNIYFIVIAILTIIYILNAVRKSKFSIEESILWMIGSFAMLILAIFPKLIDGLAKIAGIEYPPSLLFVLCIIFLILINFRNSKMIAIQKEKIVELSQQVALLKNREGRDKK